MDKAITSMKFDISTDNQYFLPLIYLGADAVKYDRFSLKTRISNNRNVILSPHE